MKEVIGLEAAADNLLQPKAWQPWEKGFEREGKLFVCDNGTRRAARRGVYQVVELNQVAPRAIVAAAWSRSREISGGRDNDYSLYLDLLYMDGSHEWGVTAPFHVGTHDWERREVSFLPAKPVRQVRFHLLLRGHAGTAWFRDPELRQIELSAKAMLFDGVPAAQQGRASAAFQVRDVAARTSFMGFRKGKALGLKLTYSKRRENGATFLHGQVEDETGKDRAITLYYTMPVKGGGWRWLAGPRDDRPAKPLGEYLTATRFNVGANGRLSTYPLAAIARGAAGWAIALDMGHPAYFRVGFSAGSSELYIAYDLGLVPERNRAEFRFCVYRFDATWGFRAALARFYEIFPAYFQSRTPQQGLWMPFHNISGVQGWEDFGFKFKEGHSETEWDDAHGMLTFRYTEPQTWWMAMPKHMPRTMEAARQEASRLAGEGNRQAQALLTSGYHDESGNVPARLLNTPWTDGAVWSVNSSPGVGGEVTDFTNAWNPGIVERLYGPGRKGDLDGEYVDSAEAYVTDELNYRREHFSGSRAPLTFSLESRRPALFKGLIVYEYVRALAEDVHGMGKLMMANSTPAQLCWLVPWLDVMGTETDWNPEGRWRPMSDSALLYRRALCGPKPYCFLMNTVFDEFPHALVEKYMKRCLAYGMFPGFFSHNASAGHYFSRPNLYERDRPLFLKYVPLCQRVAEAGWRPLTGARSSDPDVHLERFGDQYLTVFNDSAARKTAVITLEEAAPARSRELVSGRELVWTGRQMEIALEGEDVAVIQIRE